MWMWVAVGVGSFLALSLLVALAFARVLGTIGLEVSRLHEDEFWSTWQASRESERPATPVAGGLQMPAPYGTLVKLGVCQRRLTETRRELVRIDGQLSATLAELTAMLDELSSGTIDDDSLAAIDATRAARASSVSG
jgi:hypothetical protein